MFPNNDSHRIYYNVTNIELNRIVKFYSLNQVLVLLCNLNRSSFFDEDIRFRRQDPTSVQGEWGPRWGFAGRGISPFLSAGYGIESKIVAGFRIQISAGYGICHKMIAGYGIPVPRGNEIRSEICSEYPKWLFFTLLHGK